jgi:hypothetical protein
MIHIFIFLNLGWCGIPILALPMVVSCRWLCQTCNGIEITPPTRQRCIEKMILIVFAYFYVVKLRKVVSLCKFDVLVEFFFIILFCHMLNNIEINVKLIDGESFFVNYLYPIETKKILSSNKWEVFHKPFVSDYIKINQRGQLLQTNYESGYTLLFDNIHNYEMAYPKLTKVIFIQSFDLRNMYYFILTDNKETRQLLDNLNPKILKELSIENDIDVFLLSNNKILKSFNGDFGELYNNLEEYLEIHKKTIGQDIIIPIIVTQK